MLNSCFPKAQSTPIIFPTLTWLASPMKGRLWPSRMSFSGWNAGCNIYSPKSPPEILDWWEYFSVSSSSKTRANDCSSAAVHYNSLPQTLSGPLASAFSMEVCACIRHLCSSLPFIFPKCSLTEVIFAYEQKHWGHTSDVPAFQVSAKVCISCTVACSHMV